MSHNIRLKWNKLTKSKSMPKPLELEQAGCGHTLHPAGSPTHPYYCPLCRVNKILQNLNESAEAWRKEGGPDAEVLTHRYNERRKAYAYFRMELAKYMWQLELFAEKERAWEATHPGFLAGLYIHSSTAALAVARRDVPFCDVLESDFDVVAKSTGVKSVQFLDVVRDCPIRPTSYMRRSSGSYKPGRWAASVGKEWRDTSFQNDMWYGKPEYEVELDRRWFADEAE